MEYEEIINILKLEKLEAEGGLFRRTYLSQDVLIKSCLPERYSGDRPAGSLIYYMLTSDPDSFSALHKLKTDEIWHFYLGDPVDILLLYPSGETEVKTLGKDIAGGQNLNLIIPAHVWQGAFLKKGGKYALMGTTMAPAFHPDDFTLASGKELVSEYPDMKELIKRLTR